MSKPAVEPYIRVPLAYLRTPVFNKLSVRQRDVFDVLLMFSSIDKTTPAGCARISQRRIGDVLGMTHQQVGRNINALIEKGAIVKLESGDGRDANVYRLAAPVRFELELCGTYQEGATTGLCGTYQGGATSGDSVCEHVENAVDCEQIGATTEDLWHLSGGATLYTPLRGESPQDSLFPLERPKNDERYTGAPGSIPDGFTPRCHAQVGYTMDGDVPVAAECGKKLVPYVSVNPKTKDHKNDWWCPACRSIVRQHAVFMQL